RVLAPGDIDEPAIPALRSHGRSADENAHGLGAQPAQPPRREVRLAGEGERPLRRGDVGDETAYQIRRGINQKQVERSRALGGRGGGGVHRQVSSWSQVAVRVVAT